MIFGYIRVSSSSQRADRQVENILRVEPNAKLFKETFTGRSLHRPEWMRLMKTVTDYITIFIRMENGI